MKTMNMLCKGALAVAIGAFVYKTLAGKTSLSSDRETIDDVDFVDEASAKGIAEIAAAKLALEKSSSAEVKEFAQRMITDHTAANHELTELARSKNFPLADNAQLMSTARTMMLTLRDAESFDHAYAKHQVAAHEKTIALFERASRSEDADIKEYAHNTLQHLRQHLQSARQLMTQTAGVARDNSQDFRSGVNINSGEDSPSQSKPH